jgi:adenine C2-methylase RlmN of 23S rRNA A2503 and tRNA A37
MALHKSWNVRDQTENELRSILEKKYKEIDAQYKLLRKIADIETAKKMLDEIWHLKSFINTIELELIRREFYNGTSE